MLGHQCPPPAVPPVGEILDKTGWVRQGLLSVEGQSTSLDHEQSSSSQELWGLPSVGLTVLPQEERTVCSRHQAKWKLGWEGSQWDALRLVPAIPHQPGWDLHS